MKKLLIIVAVVAVAYLLTQNGDLSELISMQALKAQVAESPLQAAAWYFAVYVLATALSLPAAALLTLMGGAVFGLGWGLLLVSFASSLGATLAFLMSRTLLRDWVQSRFASYLETVNKGIEKDGPFYLFSLRLIPVIPFFAINLVFGLTTIRTWRFYWVSQLGMLAGTAVYVNAGAELGAVEELSVAGVLTPGVIGALLLLAAFPHLVRALMNYLEVRRRYRGFTRPRRFDTNLVVLGGGSAGLVSALIAAAVKAKVTLIERDKMGGDCLNTGCVPSKALIRSAAVRHEVANSANFGVNSGTLTVDFGAVMARVHQVIKTIEPHDSVERFTELGVDCIQGDGRIVSPWQVQVGDRIITTRNIVIAARRGRAYP